jgi:CRP/FNR family transcriptional regulator, cyclic AMP receptor protein
VLDERFHRCVAAWPRLIVALHERSAVRSHSLLVRLAIAEHPQIVRRVHLVLWHLADRWGRPEEDGVLLPIKLSRVTLADLVCSTRESVSRSLAELERRGLVRVQRNGYFLRFPSQGEDVLTRDRDHGSLAAT